MSAVCHNSPEIVSNFKENQDIKPRKNLKTSNPARKICNCTEKRKNVFKMMWKGAFVKELISGSVVQI